jgi:hypothetical protein
LNPPLGSQTIFGNSLSACRQAARNFQPQPAVEGEFFATLVFAQQ